ncbi:MAG: carbohydrate ABC transporter permease, partial [Caldilineaceae bacterium]|nr:carbohydrate ABC transporter permease [Caldilineaceae bacterium]
MSQTLVSESTVAPRAVKRTPWYQSRRIRKILHAVVVYALVLPGACLFILPLLWMLSTALKPPNEIFVYPPQWLPSTPRWSNFPEGWTAYLDFTQMFFNTLIITVNNVIGNLVSCCLAAYAFARLRAPGKNILFALVLATMLLPMEVTIIPQYVLF